jgi:hypothetical protein
MDRDSVTECVHCGLECNSTCARSRAEVDSLVMGTHWVGCGDTNDPRHRGCPKTKTKDVDEDISTGHGEHNS